MKQLPNILTLIRIGLIPLILILISIQTPTFYLLGAIAFIIASITDYLDGVLARSLNAQTSFGRILDPIADKLLVTCTLMILIYFNKAPFVASMLIIGREILISGLREQLAEMNLTIPVSNLGKLKTAIQYGAISILILGKETIYNYALLGDLLLWLAALLTLISAYSYCYITFKQIKEIS